MTLTPGHTTSGTARGAWSGRTGQRSGPYFARPATEEHHLGQGILKGEVSMYH